MFKCLCRSLFAVTHICLCLFEVYFPLLVTVVDFDSEVLLCSLSSKASDVQQAQWSKGSGVQHGTVELQEQHGGAKSLVCTSPSTATFARVSFAPFFYIGKCAKKEKIVQCSFWVGRCIKKS